MGGARDGVEQHAQGASPLDAPPWPGPSAGSRASSRRAWRLWAAHISHGQLTSLMGGCRSHWWPPSHGPGCSSASKVADSTPPPLTTLAWRYVTYSHHPSLPTQARLRALVLPVRLRRRRGNHRLRCRGRALPAIGLPHLLDRHHGPHLPRRRALGEHRPLTSTPTPIPTLIPTLTLTRCGMSTAGPPPTTCTRATPGRYWAGRSTSLARAWCT